MKGATLLVVLLAAGLLGARRVSAQQQGTPAAGTVPVNGGSIYYEAKGSGKPVVLLHGGLLDGRMWDAEFELLARGHRSIRFDARGAGRSSVPAGDYSNFEDLHALLLALGIERATLVGLSLGARTAIDFALTYPSMVERIVAAAPGISGWEFKDPVLMERAKAMGAAAQANDLPGYAELFVRAWIDGPKRAPGQVDAKVRERVKQMAVENLAKNASATGRVREAGAAARLGELRVPILAIVGDQDMSDIHAIVDALVKAVPGTKKILVPGTGHMINLEKPAEFDRLLLAFLDGR